MKYVVMLNGTNENPFHKMGLRQNPFPQMAKAEWMEAEMAINKLGADPIPHDRHAEHILNVLKPVGMSEEFIEACTKSFKPGEMVKLTLTFPENR